jgi:hypothetical protein
MRTGLVHPGRMVSCRTTSTRPVCTGLVLCQSGSTTVDLCKLNRSTVRLGGARPTFGGRGIQKGTPLWRELP